MFKSKYVFDELAELHNRYYEAYEKSEKNNIDSYSVIKKKIMIIQQ